MYSMYDSYHKKYFESLDFLIVIDLSWTVYSLLPFISNKHNVCGLGTQMLSVQNKLGIIWPYVIPYWSVFGSAN